MIRLTTIAPLWLLCFLTALSILALSIATAHGAETTDPVRSAVQVRCGNSAGSGTAIGPKLVLTCAHIAQGEAAGTPFLIEKHWHATSERHRGELLATHAGLDLALIAVPAAEFDHVRLVDGDPPTPQAATFLGHAGGRRELLSIRGYISRGYSTNFDLVAGHDSIEGQSGGGVFNADGYLLGVMHGRPNAIASSRGGGIFTPVRHIRGWIATSCAGPRCQPYLPPSLVGRAPAAGAPQVVPPPRRDPPIANQSQPPCSAECLATLNEQLESLSQRIDALANRPLPPGPPGPAGERGPAGRDCTLDEAHLAKIVEARIAPVIDQRVQQAVADRVPHYFSIVPRTPKGN